MTQAGEIPAVPERSDGPPRLEFAPIVLWLAVQLAALALAAARVPLAAKYPRPEELLAASLMLTVQVSASALLFPYLMRDWRTAAGVIATAWPFLMLASTLAAAPVGHTVKAGAYVTLWLVALVLWAPLITRPKLQSMGVAVAGLTSIGAALLNYLRMEFSNLTHGNGSGHAWTASGPVTAAVNYLTESGAGRSAWALPAVLAVLAFVLHASPGTRRRR